jgi:hypothetical protein
MDYEEIQAFMGELIDGVNDTIRKFKIPEEVAEELSNYLTDQIIRAVDIAGLENEEEE